LAQHRLQTFVLPLVLLLLLLFLQEAASISAPGSIFAGNFLTAEGLALLHSRSPSTAATAAAGTKHSQPENTPAAAATADSNSKPASSSSAAVNSSNRVRPSGLMSQFKWGCPDDVEQVGASAALECLCIDLHVVGPLKLPLPLIGVA
jgi:hypothetical protein